MFFHQYMMIEFVDNKVFGSASRLCCLNRKQSGRNDFYAHRDAKPTNLATLKSFSSSIFMIPIRKQPNSKLNSNIAIKNPKNKTKHFKHIAHCLQSSSILKKIAHVPHGWIDSALFFHGRMGFTYWWRQDKTLCPCVYRCVQNQTTNPSKLVQ